MNSTQHTTTGPLAGVRVLEFGSIGPGPFAAMMLADMGADVVRIERPGTKPWSAADIIRRGRRIVTLDLKAPDDVATAKQMMARADLLIEGSRPGVMERLGLGPEVALALNPGLVYGRMTGWGQEGPLAKVAGHDINYIALTGALASIGPADAPVPPLNLAGDYGGGALYLVVGLLAALHAARATGRGQVVDAAMCDGALSLMSQFHAARQQGRWTDRRRDNVLDGGAPYYGVYRCADGRFLALGAIEPQFYALLREKMGLVGVEWEQPNDRARWPELRSKLQAVVETKTRDAWCTILEPLDACVSPVLELDEAAAHPHLVARRSFTEVEGTRHPSPAPRFSATPSAIHPSVPSDAGAVLERWKLNP